MTRGGPASANEYRPSGTDTARFWSKVAIVEGACWLWTARRNSWGYGMLKVGGRSGTYVYAPRVSYAIAHGVTPAGLNVLHSCDNPACVNPAHLRVGTHGDNMRDCAAKGRLRMQRTRITHCKRGHEYTTENTILRSGSRACRTCVNAAQRRYRQEAVEYVA